MVNRPSINLRGNPQGNPATRRSGYHRQLVIMVKEPVAGRVKTRLGHDIGVSAATSFYRHTLRAVTSRLSCDPRWQTVLSVAPAPAVASVCLPAHIARSPQTGHDLGDRMQAIFARPQPGPVVIIGTDIPAVTPTHIDQAFQALGRHDVVFGPATDGGFWLVGMRRIPRVFEAFRNVRWSTADTLRDCLDGLERHRAASVATVATLSDADEAGDLLALGHVIGRHVLPKAA